jgi:transposase
MINSSQTDPNRPASAALQKAPAPSCARAEAYAEGMAEGPVLGLSEEHARAYAQGMAEGYAKGEAEGYAQGMAEGYAKGEAEGRAAAAKEYEDELLRLAEAGAIANARYWGSKSDKVKPKEISTFNDAEAVADDGAASPDAVPAREAPEALKKRSRGKKRAGVRAASIKGLAVVVVEHELKGEGALCPVCHSALKELRVDVTDRVAFVPAHFEVRRHRQHVGICPTCAAANAAGEGKRAVIVRAEMPRALLKGSIATPSLVAHIIAEKHVMSSPLYRLEKDFSRKGFYLPRSVMASWMIKAGRVWLAPLVNRLIEAMKERECLHCDETKVFVLKEPGHAPSALSYMWAWVTPASDERAIVVFRYHDTRAAEVPRGFLKGWKGYLMCDGYSAYHALGDGITVVGCLAHVRRKFTDILRGLGQKAPPGAVSLKAVEMINDMFAIDRTFKGMGADKRKEARLKLLKPKMEEFFAWAEEEKAKAVPRHSLAEALGYALNQRGYIMNVFLDGRLELTNNRAENNIRPFAVFRRNCLFSDTPKGADASAALFTLVQTALANGLKPYEYLAWVLDSLPFEDLDSEPSAVDGYLPWSEHVPESCKMPGGKPKGPAEEPVLAPPGVDVDEIERIMRTGDEIIEATVCQ